MLSTNRGYREKYTHEQHARGDVRASSRGSLRSPNTPYIQPLSLSAIYFSFTLFGLTHIILLKRCPATLYFEKKKPFYQNKQSVSITIRKQPFPYRFDFCDNNYLPLSIIEIAFLFPISFRPLSKT